VETRYWASTGPAALLLPLQAAASMSMRPPRRRKEELLRLQRRRGGEGRLAIPPEVSCEVCAEGGWTADGRRNGGRAISGGQQSIDELERQLVGIWFFDVVESARLLAARYVLLT